MHRARHGVEKKITYRKGPEQMTTDQTTDMKLQGGRQELLQALGVLRRQYQGERVSGQVPQLEAIRAGQNGALFMMAGLRT